MQLSRTVLDNIIDCLNVAVAYNANVHEKPVALLWPDENAQWQQVIERISKRVPLISLGAYEPSRLRGPAYWIRCVVAGTLDVGVPEGPVVVYMPGVMRSALRAIETCPAELAPIAELQYRSQWFSHPNHRDWSVRALLAHRERGLGLRIADDAETTSALLLALDRLLDEPIERVSKHLLDADYLLELVNEDPVRSLLRWLDDPHGFRTRSDNKQWTAFVQQCKADYGFDPTADGEVTAARKLGGRTGAWANVWMRFAETPDRYGGVVDQLRKARPRELCVANADSWPQDNERAERQLRDQLRDFEALTPDRARNEVARLENEHGWRRGTVWADLDHAPLAFALEQLVVLGELTTQPLSADDLDVLVADYAARGWQADDAVVRALAATGTLADREAVSAAAAALYLRWLDAGAKALQQAIGSMANSHKYRPGPPASATAGIVTVFIDGLRLDVARRIQERLTGAGLHVETMATLSALPTVTQTSKPALVPVAPGTLTAGPDLHASNATTHTKASIQVLRSLMTANGVQVLDSTEHGDPSGTAWTETGEIDHRGHDVGIRLVDHLDEEVIRIAARIRELLDVGWQQVEVVTDHGWVLVPGGMEKVDLPPATTEVKKGRCARLKSGAAVDVPTVPWFWDDNVRIALAPGASCFEANKVYEHGGVSPQECIVPRLAVRTGVQAAATRGPEFTKVKWLGLQCRVEFTGVTDKVVVDLRGLPAEPKSSIAKQAKETATDGKVSLVVLDEEHEGERAHLVLVAPDGQILAQREVVVGRNR
ncbi:BREX-1 system phosphatase PglZ type B [Sphaerisporangium sp. B11E5]|uniref:BREX-1 system phosphatase PglZ type B n=1 Tax=Sphaerisporangium sp. B11E5 TaxID=3153563 RepID=UPI00325E0C63